jgi:hypothetical protein
MEKNVTDLAVKAANTDKAADALHFSQASLNLANALCAMSTAKTIGK